MQIVVNPELEGLILEQVQSCRYETAEAKDSGESIEMDDQKWVEIERAGLARLREQH